MDNINGKILKININNSDYEIVSVGHRNPQGMYFDKGRNIIICTEHGPDGGDEINIIDLAKLNEKKILNYGWPIASYGEHYGGKNKKKYEKYPLFKSHKKNNFIEPLKSFSPSIAISEIVKIDENTYVFGSMGNERKGDKSLYFLNLNNEKKIKKLKVFQRVRDLTTDGNKLFIFFENPSSLCVLDLT